MNDDTAASRSEASKELARKIEVMRGALEGKRVQFTRRERHTYEGWLNINPDELPSWDWITYDYRLKPEPVVCYLRRFASGNLADRQFKRPEDALAWSEPGLTILRMVQDMDWQPPSEPATPAASEPAKPATRTAWVNVYTGRRTGCLHATKEGAEKEAFDNRLACLPIRLACLPIEVPTAALEERS